MKSWKILAVFGLIAVLFVFAGCFAGTTPEEPTATPEPTVAPTSTPTPTPFANVTVDSVSFLGDDDAYLNKAEAAGEAKVIATVTAESVVRVSAYAIKLEEIEGCSLCADACAQPETGDPIFLGKVVYSPAENLSAAEVEITVPAANLAKLEDGAHYKIYVVVERGVCGSCDTEMSGRFYYDDCFMVDVTAPKVTCGCCGAKGVVNTVYEFDSGDVSDPICGCDVSDPVAIVSSATVTSGTSSNQEIEWLVRRVDFDTVTVASATSGNSVEVNNALPGSTITVELDGLTVDITLTNEIGTCCYQPIWFRGTPLKIARITVGFDEDVTKVNTPTLSVYLNGSSSAETWSLCSDLGDREWYFYSNTTSAVNGTSFRIVLDAASFEDEAGNPGEEDGMCSGFFVEDDTLTENCP